MREPTSNRPRTTRQKTHERIAYTPECTRTHSNKHTKVKIHKTSRIKKNINKSTHHLTPSQTEVEQNSHFPKTRFYTNSKKSLLISEKKTNTKERNKKKSHKVLEQLPKREHY